ncbi:MAG: hypothetical protein JWN93_3935 [Hyphomicrobiales bacterium]|nr:hypothetical protein [Hyphomicrobiales bacterium]
MSHTIRTGVLAMAFALASGGAFADSCKIEAGSKKLAGAALTSFMKKCQTDASATCERQAADKKLHGAAKTSFTKKCLTDAVGT